MAGSNNSAYQPSDADRDLAIRTMLGEASGQGDDGLAAVAHVIMNRVKGGVGGSTPSDVVLAHGQFEPWSTRAGELANIDPKSRAYQHAGQIFDAVSSGVVPDFTNGATHFYSPAAQAKFGRNPPNWDDGSGQQIGGHLFFAPNGRVSYAGQSGIANAVDQIAPKQQVAAQVNKQPAARSEDDFYRELGVDPSAVKGAQVQKAATPDPKTDMARFYSDLGVNSADVENAPQSLGVDAQTGLTATKDANGVVTLSDPKTGQAKQAFAPGDYERWTAREGAASQVGSFAQGALNGIPIAGPAVVSGIERAAAATQAAREGVPYDTALANVQQQANLDKSVYPTTNTVGNVAGATTAYMGAGAVPGVARALGMSGGSLAGQMAAGATSNALIGRADAYARGQDPRMGVAYGAAGGAAGPVIGKVASGVLNGVGAAIAPFTESGRGNIANNLITRFADNGPTSANANQLVPGSIPTLAQATANPGLATLERGLRDVNPNLFIEREAANSSARDAAFGAIKGDSVSLDNLIQARAQAADPLRDAALANPQGPADASGVMNKINEILASPAGQRDSVVKALGNIQNKLVTGIQEMPDGSKLQVLQDDPRQLYGVRQAIGDMLSPLARNTDSNAQLASRELMQVRGELDNAIEGSAPGFKNYLQTFADMSKPVNAQELLQKLNVTDSKGNMTLAKVDNAIKNVEKARGATGANDAKSLSFDDMNTLYALRDDLRRQANSGLGKSIGSNTFQNLATNNIAANAGMPLAAASFLHTSNPLVLALGYGARKAYASQNQAILNELTHRMLDPTTQIGAQSIGNAIGNSAGYGTNAFLHGVGAEYQGNPLLSLSR